MNKELLVKILKKRLFQDWKNYDPVLRSTNYLSESNYYFYVEPDIRKMFTHKTFHALYRNIMKEYYVVEKETTLNILRRYSWDVFSRLRFSEEEKLFFDMLLELEK